ncbi:MAG: hypothetical protein Hyperionvirus6_10 [Hyperionvirus sp.]|uniref:BTB domain-containing protein n=1 Tax=Hyperionvirus sp. TaxID=2487770 RepID=A0A3G5AD84_9VIRU|nr:MAG: hypothetical protein Hyperionvirus6_10 [Hyperionvirus sp.]
MSENKESHGEEIVAVEGKVVATILKILENGKGDIRINAKDGYVTAFSEILMETSEPFKKMLSDKFSEHRERKISFETYGYEAVKSFIYYIHGDIPKYPCSFRQTFDLLELCELYGFKIYAMKTIENIIEYTDVFDAIMIMCLCERYVCISSVSKLRIINNAKRHLFGNLPEMVEQYLENKGRVENDRSLESKEDDIGHEDDCDPLEYCRMLEKMMDEYVKKRVSISLKKYSDIAFMIDNKEDLELYPILNNIFTRLGEDWDYITKEEIMDLQSTDDYIITKKTYEALEFIFL